MGELGRDLAKNAVKAYTGVTLIKLSRSMSRERKRMKMEKEAAAATTAPTTYEYVFYENAVTMVIDVVNSLLEILYKNGIMPPNDVLAKTNELVSGMQWVLDSTKKKENNGTQA